MLCIITSSCYIATSWLMTYIVFCCITNTVVAINRGYWIGARSVSLLDANITGNRTTFPGSPTAPFTMNCNNPYKFRHFNHCKGGTIIEALHGLIMLNYLLSIKYGNWQNKLQRVALKTNFINSTY